MKFKCILVLLLSVCIGKAQVNLVPNGSFEEINGCPTSSSLFDTIVNNWFQPTNGTSDLYTECSTISSGRNVPYSAMGFQYAQQDSSYAGIITYWPGIGNYREYIAVKLTDSLKQNMYYCLKYYVNLSNEEPLIISSIGAYFTKDSLHFDNLLPVPVIPQIANPDSNFISDTITWKLITGYFQAQGGEKYMYMGNFRNDQNTVIQSGQIPGTRTYLY